MTEERLKEIKDSIDFQEKIANAYNCGDVVIVLNEERELYNEVVRLREIIDKLEKLELYIFEPDYDWEENPIDNYTPFNINEYINTLNQSNLTLEQLTGIAND